MCGPNRTTRIDPCIRRLISTLNNHGVRTLGSCCGHGVYPLTIVVEDRDGPRELLTGMFLQTSSLTPKPKKARFYKRDSQGRYYIPEVSQPLGPELKAWPDG